MFAITKHHAARLARYLNELHPEHQGRYAEVITSDVAEPDALIRKFKNETYPMVAVSVGMLDTGFDCREVLHLVLCRRVRSPILYQQMRVGAPAPPPTSASASSSSTTSSAITSTSTTATRRSSPARAGAARRATRPRRHSPPASSWSWGLDDEWLQAVTYVEVGPRGRAYRQGAVRQRLAGDDPVAGGRRFAPAQDPG